MRYNITKTKNLDLILNQKPITVTLKDVYEKVTWTIENYDIYTEQDDEGTIIEYYIRFNDPLASNYWNADTYTIHLDTNFIPLYISKIRNLNNN